MRKGKARRVERHPTTSRSPRRAASGCEGRSGVGAPRLPWWRSMHRCAFSVCPLDGRADPSAGRPGYRIVVTVVAPRATPTCPDCPSQPTVPRHSARRRDGHKNAPGR